MRCANYIWRLTNAATRGEVARNVEDFEELSGLARVPLAVIAMVVSDRRDMRPFQIEDYRSYVATGLAPDLEGICQKIRSEFAAGSSGIYFAKSLSDILASKRLEGCQDWGRLWSHIIQNFGINCTYVQCVDTQWLDEHGAAWRGDGWRGHVFLEIGPANGLVTFCSTTARRVARTGAIEGRDVIDGKFVVLFKGIPEEFGADTQEGINGLLRPLVDQWKQPK